MRTSLSIARIVTSLVFLALLLSPVSPLVGQQPARRDAAREEEYQQKLRQIERLQDQIDRLIEELRKLDAPPAAPAEERVPAVKLDRVGASAGGLAGNMSLGWEFETNAAIEVTALGIWDHGKGIDTDFPVAIWNDAGKVVVSTTVPAIGETIAVDEFRYKPIKPVKLEAGKRYVISALYTPATELHEVIGNGASITTRAPIRWIAARRERSPELALPEARADERNAVGSFGPNFLMTPSEATKKPGLYYRSRSIGWPPKDQIAILPEKEDGSHREVGHFSINLFANRKGELTQVVVNDKPLGVGAKALESLAAGIKELQKLPPEMRPVFRVAAMPSVKEADRAAVAKHIDREYLEPGVAREDIDGILSFALARVKFPAVEGDFPVADRFKDHDKYIEDRWTGLLWQKDGLAAGKKNFYEAKEYAEKLELGELKAWRVPTADELRTIFPATFAPFNDKKYTPKQCCAGPEEFASYWTSELDLSADDYAYVFHWYAGGGANNCFASKNYVYVRCVHDPAEERQ